MIKHILLTVLVGLGAWLVAFLIGLVLTLIPFVEPIGRFIRHGVG